jgi:L-2,4-diaminobutyrate decarboxylase
VLVADELTAARERIAAAYDPCLLEDAGHRLAALLGAHLAQAERSKGPVLPWIEPPEGIREAAALLASAPARVAEVADHFARLVKIMLDRGLNLHDPRYIGHQVPAPVPVAGLFDAVGSVTNQVMAIYEMGPWSNRP